METGKFKFTGSMLKAMQACASTDMREHGINAVHVKGNHLMATNAYVWIDVHFSDCQKSNEHFQLDRVRVDGISAKLKLTMKEMNDFMGQEPGRFPQQDIYESYYRQREMFDQERGKGVSPKFLMMAAKVFKVFNVPMQLSIRSDHNIVLACGKHDGITIHAVIAGTNIR